MGAVPFRHAEAGAPARNRRLPAKAGRRHRRGSGRGHVRRGTGDIGDLAGVQTEISAVRTELKADIAAVRSELAALRTELKADIAAVRSELAALRTELKADIAAVRSELAALRTELKADIELLRRDLTIRLGSMIVVAVGILLAAIRYLPPPHP
jgi:ABC-type phosphate transport system auxiliary subunit